MVENEPTALTLALQVTPVYRVLSTGMVRVSVKESTEPVAVEVVVMGSEFVVTTHVTSTTTFTPTAEFTVMERVRVRDVPAVRGEGGGVTDTPGAGTVTECYITTMLFNWTPLLSTTTVLVCWTTSG